jgi:hypothetical protein
MARPGRPQVKLAIGAAILIVVASVAYLAWGSASAPVAGSHPPGHPSRSPSSAPSPSLGPWQYITTRSTDPVPLGVQELFPASFTAGGHTYLRASAAVSASCKSALVGAGLRSAAQQAGCDQVLRGTYVSARADEMGTIGVLNLQSFTAATTAGKATGRSDYIALLKTKHGLTRRLGNGTGIEEAIVKGHYLILGWAEFGNLSAPRTLARRAELGAFLNTLIQQTANVSLSYRMVDGKPPAG